MPNSLPLVSIIIPTHNSEKMIERCLQSVFALNYPKDRYEVILVDDSTDNTIEIAVKHKARVINVIGSTGAKRNRGTEISNGDILAFIDDDCFVTRDWLLNLMNGLNSDEVAECGGPNLTPPDSPLKAKCAGYILSHWLGSGGIRYGKTWSEKRYVDHNPSCNMAVKKSAFLKVGGFPEDFWPSEDVEFDSKLLKMGYKILYEPKAAVYHERKKTLREILTQFVRYGKNRVLINKIDRFTVKATYFIPPLTIVAATLLLGLGLINRVFPHLFLGLVLLYFTIFETYALRIWIKEKDWRYLIMLPIVALAIHLGWGIGFLFGVFKYFSIEKKR